MLSPNTRKFVQGFFLALLLDLIVSMLRACFMSLGQDQVHLRVNFSQQNVATERKKIPCKGVHFMVRSGFREYEE